MCRHQGHSKLQSVVGVSQSWSHFRPGFCRPVCLSVLSVCPPACISVSVCLSCLPLCMYIAVFVCLYIFLISAYLSACVHICLLDLSSFFIFIFQHIVFLSVVLFLSTYLSSSAYLSSYAYLSPVCASLVYLPVSDNLLFCLYFCYSISSTSFPPFFPIVSHILTCKVTSKKMTFYMVHFFISCASSQQVSKLNARLDNNEKAIDEANSPRIAPATKQRQTLTEAKPSLGTKSPHIIISLRVL